MAKVVIDIPDEEYETLSKLSEKEKINELSYYERVVAHGTVLPKGHGRLIDANALKEEVNHNYLVMKNTRVIEIGWLNEYVIDCMPTVIEADKGE